jgi:hypothetical protein
VGAVLLATTLISGQILERFGGTVRSDRIIDHFDGTADGLGETTTGETWDTVTDGTWARDGGVARVTQPNPRAGARTMALVDLSSDNGSVSGTVGQVAPGWGLVFRYRSPSEFWTLTAAPRFAAFNLQHVHDGRAESLGQVTMARQEPGTVVLVRFQGSDITIEINGRAVKELKDPDGGNGGLKVGLVLAEASGTDARWDEFEARRLPLSASPKAARPVAPTSTTRR